MSEDVTGNVLSIPTKRTHPSDSDWSVEFHLRTQYPLDIDIIRVRVFNDNNNQVYDVYGVRRVQFVPIPSVDNEFYLRLYNLSVRGEEQVVENDTKNLAPLLLGSENLSAPRSAWFLRFNIQDILRSRNSWSTDVGWQLLRCTNANSFSGRQGWYPTTGSTILSRIFRQTQNMMLQDCLQTQRTLSKSICGSAQSASRVLPMTVS
jgi:hypothetical protein